MEPQIDADYLQAEIYDQYYGPYAELYPWLVDLLLQRDSVLELACGTGRVALPLARRGLSVAGIDYSPPMLDLAREKARQQHIDIDLSLGDFRDFDLGRRFGAILLLSNALWHVHTRADFEALMRCVRRHLQPGGLFVIHVFVPDLDILNRDPRQRHPFNAYTDPQTGERVEVTQTSVYEPDTQISRVVQYKGHTDEVVGGLNLRMYFPQELDALLAYNGMTIDEKFGDGDRSPFAADSKRQLYLCSCQKPSDE